MKSDNRSSTTYPGLERTPVDLPSALVSDVEDRLQHLDFESPGEYIAFVLEEVLLELDEVSDPAGDELDEDEIEERLQALGYLDD